MKNNTFKSLIVSILVGTIFVPALAFASPIPTAPATDGANIGGADIAVSNAPVAPRTAGANTGGADTVPPAPATAGANIGGADTIPVAPATDGANIGGADTVPVVTPPTTPAQTPGGNTSSGSGSSSGGHSGRSVLLLNNTCPLFNSYLKFGSNNPVSEVTKLQSFLKNVEGLNVDINGIFDTKTVEAVKAFQTKYANEVMTPWGMTVPTGNVYITTKQKIDEISCNMKLSLTSDKLAEINNYKNGISTTDSTVIDSNSTDSNDSIDNNGTTSSPEVGASTDNNDQTAAVVKTSLWSRIWNAIKNIFRD